MIQTSKFKTKTMYLEKNNLKLNGLWPIAIDIGYSAVKVYSPNAIGCFPSYAQKLRPGRENNFLDQDKNRILYRDIESGVVWTVGETAQILSDGISDCETELYGKNRIFSEMYLVIARTGMALGMIKNHYGDPNGKQLAIQTGLPPKYLASGAGPLKQILSGEHHFQLKLGESEWKNFHFLIKPEMINLLAQPMGTLYSIVIDKNGYQVRNAKEYFKSNVIILDPGFGTFDTFYIRNGSIYDYDTFPEYGMKEIFDRTCKEIFNRYGREIPVSGLQNYLGNGKITYSNVLKRTTKEVSFADILEDKTKQVCLEALEKTYSIFNGMIDCRYLIVTGGTSNAWKNDILKFFSGMETIKIIFGNENEDLPSIFNNVRGYYMYLYGTLRSKK